MSTQSSAEAAVGPVHEPKYFLNIEGREVGWDEPTISVAKIIELADWPAGTEVIEVDQHNVERTLPANAVIELQPGHGFGKKHKWKRG